MTKLTTLERTFLDAWYKYGIDAEPIHNYPIDGQKFDFAWPQYFVCVELNGMHRGHVDPKAVARDAAKVRAAMVLGWIPLVFWTPCLHTEQQREDAVNTVMYFCIGKQ